MSIGHPCDYCRNTEVPTTAHALLGGNPSPISWPDGKRWLCDVCAVTQRGLYAPYRSEDGLLPDIIRAMRVLLAEQGKDVHPGLSCAEAQELISDYREAAE